MTDTHTHLYYIGDTIEEGAGAVRRAIDAGVTRMVFPSVSLTSFCKQLELVAMFPDEIRVAIGIHPTDLTPSWENDLREMERLSATVSPVAIGETGIDLHWDDVPLPLQRQAFAAQLDLALQMSLPVIIHSRDALAPTLEELEACKTRNGKLPRLVFHSFTGTPEDVKAIRKVCDPLFGINGVVTFKNAREVREAVKEIGIERIILETDSPYLSPVPWRGTPNESSRLPAIRDMVASVTGLSPAEVETVTDANADLFFP